MLKESERSKVKILMVEDEVQMSNLLRSILTNVGFTLLVHASDQAQALELFEKERPDVVLLDIHLGADDGVDVLRQMLALDGNAHVVMVSGVNTFDNVKKTIELGAKGFIVKPFKINKILDAIHHKYR